MYTFDNILKKIIFFCSSVFFSTNITFILFRILSRRFIFSIFPLTMNQPIDEFDNVFDELDKDNKFALVNLLYCKTVYEIFLQKVIISKHRITDYKDNKDKNIFEI